jgi:hypothetical protein
VPTDEHVELHYGWTGVDALGWGTTALGLAGLVWLWRAGPIAMPADPPRRIRRRKPDDGDEAEVGDDADSAVPAASFDPAEVILGPAVDRPGTPRPPRPPPSADDDDG